MTEISAATSDSDRKKSLEYGDELMGRGDIAAEARDYAGAGACYRRAPKIRVEHFGELAPERVNAYYKYGYASLDSHCAEDSDVVDHAVAPCAVESDVEDHAHDDEVVHDFDLDKAEKNLEIAWVLLRNTQITMKLPKVASSKPCPFCSGWLNLTVDLLLENLSGPAESPTASESSLTVEPSSSSAPQSGDDSLALADKRAELESLKVFYNKMEELLKHLKMEVSSLSCVIPTMSISKDISYVCRVVRASCMKGLGLQSILMLQ